eukprot:Em0081g7a
MGLVHRITISFLLGWALKIEAQLTCQRAVGNYRDCTCGAQYRDVEQRCCNDQTCLQPTVFTENMTCPFQCLNNGTFDAENHLCQCSEGSYGICCEKETATCGGILLQSQGEVSYQSNASFNDSSSLGTEMCSWIIATSSNRNIALGLKNNNLSIDANDCLFVYDGASRASPVVGTYCGTHSSFFETVYSTSRHLYIELVSNRTELSLSVFRLSYVTFLKGQSCGPWSVYTRPTGIITSPYYPLPYRPNESCLWQIGVASGYNLILTVLKFDIDCLGDNVEVNGVEEETSFLLISLCSRSALGQIFVINGVSTVLLTFTSHNSTESNTGFVIRYEQIPDV